jgi:hypothetical protein
MASEGMEHYRRLGSAVIFPLAFVAGGPAMPDLKLLALAKELRDRAAGALVRVETFHDPDCKRLMRQIAATYEELAERLEKEANDRPWERPN